MPPLDVTLTPGPVGQGQKEQVHVRPKGGALDALDVQVAGAATVGPGDDALSFRVVTPDDPLSTDVSVFTITGLLKGQTGPTETVTLTSAPGIAPAIDVAGDAPEVK